MTPEEINKIAKEYIEEVYGGDTDFIDEAENVLRWISEGYCLVPKSDVKRFYNVDKCTIRDHRKRCGDKAQIRAAARIRLCESLFGKSLFEEATK